MQNYFVGFTPRKGLREVEHVFNRATAKGLRDHMGSPRQLFSCMLLVIESPKIITDFFDGVILVFTVFDDLQFSLIG